MTYYPNSIAAFTTKVDFVNVVDANDVDSLQNEVTAIETALGVNPAVSPTAGTFPSLGARVGSLETGKSPVGHTHVHATLTDLNANDHPQYMLTSVASGPGQVIVGGGTQSLGAVPAGTAGDVLTANPTAPLGVVWLPSQLPVGAVIMWAGPSGAVASPAQMTRDYTASGGVLPYGFLLCDGATYAIDQYPDLYAVIGNMAGSARTGYFLVPNLQGRFPVGAGTGPGFTSDTHETYAPGVTGGQLGVQPTIQQMPKHNHALVDPGHVHDVTDPAHAHNPQAVNSSYGGGFMAKYSPSSYGGSADSSDYLGQDIAGEYQAQTAAASTAITINTSVSNTSISQSGGTDYLPTVPPYLALYFLIRY